MPPKSVRTMVTFDIETLKELNEEEVRTGEVFAKDFVEYRSPTRFIYPPEQLYAIASIPVHISTARETFVVNQLSVNHAMEYGKTQGDFLVDHKYTFEVGKAYKTFKLIADLPNFFILADNIEYNTVKKLPLWIVGLTY